MNVVALPNYLWVLGLSAVILAVMFWPVAAYDKNKLTTALRKLAGYIGGTFSLLVIWLIYFIFN